MSSKAQAPETEADTRSRYISPALVKSGWQFRADSICEEYYFTDGKILVRGKSTARGERKKVDYLLLKDEANRLAVIEAKSTSFSVGHGLQQAIGYAERLDVPFAYSSNGKGFREHDLITGAEREISIDAFPNQDALWKRFAAEKKYTAKQINALSQPWFYEPGSKTPRYYQRIAVDRTIEAVAGGKNRILLVMATGTGKTYTAFQIIHRLREAGLIRKVLYLADRNVLIDQTIQNDFKPFEKVIKKVTHRTLNSSYEIYMSLYQQLIDSDEREVFRDFKPEFFDLIIVDECHRGSAKDNSQWRRILDYFSGAVQIGMTATPKETEDVSNSAYFGEPIYTYSLRDGIEDGFLAPYNVVRVNLDIDETGYTPAPGERDLHGKTLENRVYSPGEFDRTLVINERTDTVAKKITQFLRETNPYGKTIVFCVDIDHAERMRDKLAELNADLMSIDSRYVMKITGDDNEGKAQLDNFIDPGSKYPVIVTTSELLSTGVDCKDCRVIVLDKTINSISSFKQIIGRGTRIREDVKKLYFTILDFRGVTRLFADPDFDGEPASVHEQKESDPGPLLPPDDGQAEPDDGKTEGADIPPEAQESRKYIVRGQPVYILEEIIRYYDKDGKLITGDIRTYTKKGVAEEYASLKDFLCDWNSGKKKSEIIRELANHGVLLEELRRAAGNPGIDDFDLICRIAWDKKPLTRAERVNNVKKRGYLYKYEGAARQVIEALLEHYAKTDITEIEDAKVLQLDEFHKFGSPTQIARMFGGSGGWRKFIKDLEEELYEDNIA